MKRAVITGAGGFIGSNLMKHLSDLGIEVVGLVRKADPTIGPIGAQKTCDIVDHSAVAEILHSDDVIFHAAGKVSFSNSDFPALLRDNVESTQNILECAFAAGARKVIHLSACAVLGTSANKADVLDENANPEIPKSNPYAYTKQMAEEQCRTYARRGLDVSIGNIATVYGAGDRKLNSGSIIKKILEGGMRFVPPGGTSYVTVKDLVDGLYLIAINGRRGERYILSAENLEYKSLIQRIAEALNVNKGRLVLPRAFRIPLSVALTLREKIIKSDEEKTNLLTSQILNETFSYKYFSSAKAKRDLGWIPKQSLESAVEEALGFYRSIRVL